MTMPAPARPTPPDRARSATAAPRWHGALEGRSDSLVMGWALDCTEPEARVVVEVCLDGEPLGSALADVARPDLAAQLRACCPQLGDHCHGFVLDLGAQHARLRGQLTVRVANTGQLLAGRLAAIAQQVSAVSASSCVLSDGALRLHGWALDPDDPERQLEVQAYQGHQLLASSRANLAHAALRAYQVGQHGFTLDLPLTLADGGLHEVRIVDQQGRPLHGSPLTVCCHLSGLQPLLQQQADAEAGAALLQRVIEVYEQHLPRSLGLQHYPAWAAHFERSAPAPLPAALTALRLGVLISGAGALRRTSASLKAQGLPLQVYSKGPYADRLRAALADGCEVLLCIRAGDTLAPHALAHALPGLLLPHAQLVYTDSEYAGQPWFKPAWNPEYALASDYPLDGLLLRASLGAAVLAAAPPDDAASLAWEALARLWPQGARAIVHVPRVLYQLNSPLSEGERSAREHAARRALQQLEPRARLDPLPEAASHPLQAARRLQRPLNARERAKKVSLIIPTRDQGPLLQRCIDSLRRYTDWPALELIVIDNGSSEPASCRYLRQLAREGVRVLALPGPFNFADLNNQAVAAASGELVGLINNDIEALAAGWLDELVGQLLRPGVGAVGAKLLWPNGMVQHGGVLLGVGSLAGHYGTGLADSDWGDHGRNQLVQQVSGVTAACLLLRKKDYLAVGGMDRHAFPVAFNDVDLCLKLRRRGLAIVWTPQARLLHAESASRGHDDTPPKRARAQREAELLRQRWGPQLLRDPAYHPSLNLDPRSPAYSGLALPPRPRTPRPGHFEEQEH